MSSCHQRAILAPFIALTQVALKAALLLDPFKAQVVRVESIDQLSSSHMLPNGVLIALLDIILV